MVTTPKRVASPGDSSNYPIFGSKPRPTYTAQSDACEVTDYTEAGVSVALRQRRGKYAQWFAYGGKPSPYKWLAYVRQDVREHRALPAPAYQGGGLWLVFSPYGYISESRNRATAWNR